MERSVTLLPSSRSEVSSSYDLVDVHGEWQGSPPSPRSGSPRV